MTVGELCGVVACGLSAASAASDCSPPSCSPSPDDDADGGHVQP